MTSAERPEADTVEQRRPVGQDGDEGLRSPEPADVDTAWVDPSWAEPVEADPADAADQHRDVDPGDEDDYPRA